ncbi:MAG: ABC transporter ATP-binding protein [Oscillospiraceae bacterium]
MLEVKNLSCGYGSDIIVKDVSFTVNDGEILAVTGPNGCGKTTLLRALCGIIPYAGGSAVIDGKEIRSLSREELSMSAALLPQTGAGGEYSDFTVRETVALGRYAKSKGFGGSKEDEAAAEKYMEMTDTLSIADKVITELSGGQLQRVLLARSFAQEPKIIFLDEPANHLDLKRQIELIGMLKEWAKSGKSVVGVFHDLNLAAELSDRIMVMSDGRTELLDTAETVCRSEKLNDIYGFDIREYMRKTLRKWE